MRHDPSEASFEAAEPGKVRRSIWLLLACSLLLALLAPALTLWHATSSALAARACVWPAAPSVNQPAELRIVVPDATDRAAIHGPWAHVVADWDMLTMSMGRRQRAAAGDSAADGTYVFPLTLDMAGSWQVQVALSTPGRPEWRASLQVRVLPPGAPSAPAATAVSATAGACPST